MSDFIHVSGVTNLEMFKPKQNVLNEFSSESEAIDYCVKLVRRTWEFYEHDAQAGTIAVDSHDERHAAHLKSRMGQSPHEAGRPRLMILFSKDGERGLVNATVSLPPAS